MEVVAGNEIVVAEVESNDAVGECSNPPMEDEGNVNEDVMNSDPDVDTDAEFFNDVNAGNEMSDDENVDNDMVMVVESGEGSSSQSLSFYSEYLDDVHERVEEWDFHPLVDFSDLIDEFQKGMRFKDKKMIIQTVNNFHILLHCNYEVVKSTKTLWNICCSEFEKGCKWRLRAIQPKEDDEFESYEQPKDLNSRFSDPSSLPAHSPR
ncbi:hypothetical protein MLD38_018180 [Melastoma candidum]|uniref:Uncharacterized protein n=1 Tax=Melastoma candidum TaxID=119954 RepID=A0ACB9QT22_9MYRT|nr:hypothetical protein MLD38_018180 [Melastoma candidum]